MRTIISAIEQGRVSYSSVIQECKFNINWDGETKYGIVIPVRGREQFLPLLLDSFKKTNHYSYTITVVEHSDTPIHEHTCARPDINYIHIPAHNKPFNKCLAMNIGVIASCPASYYIFHDLDCLVQRNFLENLDAFIDVNDAEAVQTFRKRRLLYCSQELTDRLLGFVTDVNDLDINSTGVSVGNEGAPGGSILVSSALFFAVGGFDPELFWTYAPEDDFFLHKLTTLSTFYSCHSNELYHMYHPSSVNTNPDLKRMVALNDKFKALSLQNKEDVIEYKRKLIEKYVVG